MSRRTTESGSRRVLWAGVTLLGLVLAGTAWAAPGSPGKKKPIRPNTPAVRAQPAERGCPYDVIDATSALAGGTVTGSTLGAPNLTGSHCGGESSPEVVYAIRPTQPGPIEVSAAHPGSDYDTMLSVRTDCDDPADELACNDDSAGLLSRITFDAEACVTYYVVIEGYAASSGAYELSFTQEATGSAEKCRRDNEVSPATRANRATPATPATPGGPGGPAVPPTFPVCEHSPCTTGVALESDCSPCVATVCATDAYCCNNAWDGLCVNEAADLCGGECAPTCGDGWCGGAETCGSCPGDCGPCPECGNGACEASEWCDNCAADCGACPPPPMCGDGFCDFNEDCSFCPDDCGACPPPPACGDAVCDWSEWCGSCPDDCGECPPPPVCGDALCDFNEDCGLCPDDCGACPPPPGCGDGVCEAWEVGVCIPDCGEPPPPVCGDGTCNASTETCGDCEADCGACGLCAHGVCTQGEPLTPDCNDCAASVCLLDPFCCSTFWDFACTSGAAANCGVTCGP